ncbi:hypothetical protein ACFO9Q_19110 [Paenibacillus sp. GCM10023252]|uniref:hypothetical protein n=1 Tax=Paenibacillus sp. GCM10023252 TaxID=3252649 RepID=UPI0036113BD4
MNRMTRSLSIILIIIVSLTACSSSVPPKEALALAMAKTAKLESYALQMTLGIDELALPAQAAGEAPAMALLAPLLGGAEVHISALYQKDPMRMDMNLELTTAGSMAFKLTLPIILADDKLYVKLPQTPLLPIPEAAVGKSILIDLKQLAEQEEAGAALDAETLQKLTQEVGAELLSGFDNDTYFSEPKPSEAELPKGLEADRIVRFKLEESNYPATVDIIVKKTLPAILDILLSDDDYLKALKLNKGQLEEEKSQLDKDSAAIIDRLGKELLIREWSMTSAIKDGYLIHQAGSAAMEQGGDKAADKLKLALHYDAIYKDLNKKVQFAEEIPAPSDVLTLEQLTKLMAEAGAGAAAAPGTNPQ